MAQAPRRALAQARGIVRSRFGTEYLPAGARVFRSPARYAQEAHEAIRTRARRPPGASRPAPR